MLNEHYDVTTAAYAVGYESLSHFRREYLRMQEILHISLSIVCKTENKQQIINMKC